ncbi:unnamed protein product [marine sediment metagenome]|uniref:DUF3052 domain-containing protein n=1 Tax=marine sediment metagenome TaxID=412755 RepID=X0VNF7_9ZZZZ
MVASLIKKLRIQPGQRMLILNAPSGYANSLGELPEGAELSELPEGEFDFVHLFVRDSNEFANLGPPAIEAVKYDSLLGISYPKKSSKVESDLSRDVMWELMADTGLRPVTQISIDPVWSALRFRPTDEVGR